MSISLINQYYNKVDDLIRYSGKNNEGVISREFEWLINAYCEKRKLKLIPQFEFKSALGTSIRPDGTIKNDLRLDYGYWESKAKVDLEKEIAAKFNAGYPKTNILFEDSKTAVLYQQGERVMTADLRNAQELDKILTAFTTYEHPEVKNFNKAVETFKNDIPKIVVALREMISKEEKSNAKFKDKRSFFWDLCKNSINPDISLIEINEMLIQHILTEEIFISIFSDAQFHQENNIAKELYEVEKTFFTGNTKRELLNNVRNYYEMIKAHATGIVSHTEKQTFLKSIYENFYKAYNPKGADRLGIVYTPSEIVKFQIESTDYLLEKHFGKTLSDKNVEILDPATGTGTYICDLLEYIPAQYLDYKYKHEIHANEVAILPYYIANLNIEYVFQQKMGYYGEFKNICFVDTLDMGYAGRGQTGFDFGLGEENALRIKAQNARKISVVMGNPPYNANQQNENDNNKNREYFTNKKKKVGGVDGRIKESYILESTAQKTKQYDMYKRFIRWASDRIGENGMICFITNRSFIDKRQDDGFRKCVSKEFDFLYIVDLGGDIRDTSEDSKTNVFGIMTGVAISFLVKKPQKEKNDCKIVYYKTPNIPAAEKLSYLQTTKMQDFAFERISPTEKGQWINIADTDFEEFLPIADKKVKLNKEGKQLDQAIFKLYFSPFKTNRDEWVYDFDKKNLENKIPFFIEKYNRQVDSKLTDNDNLDYSIKWSSTLKEHLYKSKKLTFNADLFVKIPLRPFVKTFYYTDKLLSDRLTENHYKVAGKKLDKSNVMITINEGGRLSFSVLGTSFIPNYGFYVVDATQSMSLYCYDENGNQTDNITDWALQQYTTHYQDNSIQKQDIFHYVYAVLHNPAYRQKYELNLKRDFPRIPFYTDFEKWAAWGKALMALHIDYETVAPFPLTRKDAQAKQPKKKAENLLSDLEPPKALFEEQGEYTFVPKAKLKADKEQGHIIIDDLTTLTGVPAEAWEYKLGNRSALEWVLDQYKESKPSDPTIAAKFNTYKFADYKEVVIDLLLRVCTVSVETQRIVGEMGA